MTREWQITDWLDDFLSERFSPHMLSGKAASTSNKYRYAVQHFSDFLQRRPTIGDLEEVQLTQFSHWLERAPHTVNCYVNKLTVLADYAFGKRILAEKPFVRPLRTYDDEPVAMTAGQFAALIQAARTIPGWVAFVPRALWLESLAWAIFDTAFRVGGMLSLKWSGVDEANGTVFVRGEDQKSGKFARRAVHPATMALLLKMKNPLADEENVWPFPWRDQTGFYAGPTRRLFTAAGLWEEKDLRWHSIRKLTGTLVADQFGVAAGAEYLQHSNVDTFRRHYLDGRQCHARVIDEIPRPEVQAA